MEVKTCRLLIFGKRLVFPVFHNSDNLNAFPSDEPEVAADGALGGTEDTTGKLPIDKRDTRLLAGIVLPGEVTACQHQRCRRSAQIAGRDVVLHCVSSGV